MTLVSRLDRTYCVRLFDPDGAPSGSDSRKEYRDTKVFSVNLGMRPIKFGLIASHLKPGYYCVVFTFMDPSTFNSITSC